MIRFSSNILIFTAVFVIVLFANVSSRAGSSVAVQRIDEAVLDELIQAKENRMLVTFVAAWCGPCIDELPALNKLYKRYKNLGLTLIGISIDLEGPAAMQPIVNKLKVDFPVYWYGEEAVKKFKLTAIPMLFFIRQGQIVDRIHGKRSEAFLDGKIQKFLK